VNLLLVNWEITFYNKNLNYYNIKKIYTYSVNFVIFNVLLVFNILYFMHLLNGKNKTCVRSALKNTLKRQSKQCLIKQ